MTLPELIDRAREAADTEDAVRLERICCAIYEKGRADQAIDFSTQIRQIAEACDVDF